MVSMAASVFTLVLVLVGASVAEITADGVYEANAGEGFIGSWGTGVGTGDIN